MTVCNIAIGPTKAGIIRGPVWMHQKIHRRALLFLCSGVTDVERKKYLLWPKSTKSTAAARHPWAGLEAGED